MPKLESLLPLLIMNLEARLAEELEDFSDSDTTSEPDPPGEAPRDPMGPTALSYDLLPPASRPEPETDPALLNHSATINQHLYYSIGKPVNYWCQPIYIHPLIVLGDPKVFLQRKLPLVFAIL